MQHALDVRRRVVHVVRRPPQRVEDREEQRLARGDRDAPLGRAAEGTGEEVDRPGLVGQAEAAAAIETAVRQAIDDGYRTPDLLRIAGEDVSRLRPVGTSGLTEAIVERVGAVASAA